MSDIHAVQLSSGLPETVLESEPPEVLSQLQEALKVSDQDDRRDAVAKVVAAHPRFLDAWAQLGLLARDDIEAYAYFRVAYHRGLDHLRKAGWRGSGYVRWKHESNRGFLRALQGLARQAQIIGELDEAQRCALFVGQLDPTIADLTISGNDDETIA